MITAEKVRSCRGTREVAALFRELGYPIRLQPLDPAAWRALWVTPPAGLRVSHACGFPGFDLYFVEGSGEDAPRFAAEMVGRFAHRNRIHKTVIVYIDDRSDRFSLFGQNSRGRLRRIDFHPDESPSAIADRLNLLAVPPADAASELPRIFDRMMDREEVTARFFAAFRRMVERLTRALRLRCPGETNEAVADEALLILSRILFLYFVQQKGWLDERGSFLVDALHSAMAAGTEFYSTVLVPLFFECLNTPLEDRSSRACGLGRIPYLNGGLFEPSPFELRNRSLSIPDELFVDAIEGVFERFSFTIEETAPGDGRIDPEMLGRVFESLMEGAERLTSGSYYTPRPIVDALVERSIVEWLSEGDESLGEVLKSMLAGDVCMVGYELAVGALARLRRITLLDPACGSGAFLLSALSVIERLVRALSATVEQPVPPELRRSIVEQSLFGVDLKSQAVRLCELRLWLAIVAGTDSPIEKVRPLPNLDRNIRQGNSLLSPLDFLGDARREIYREWSYALRAQRELLLRYRHALPEQKPDLARMLRSWDLDLAKALLRKAVERDEEELAALSAPGPDLFGNERKENSCEKNALLARLDENRRGLERVERGDLWFFSFELHFAPIMAAGGFDVVAGNPPWVRNSRIPRNEKRFYSERYRFFRPSPGQRGFDQTDLAVAFVERSLSLAARDGVVSLLVPSKVLGAGYAAGMRAVLARDHSIVAIDDWSADAQKHFGADTFPLGITVRTAPGPHQVELTSGGVRERIDQSDLTIEGGESAWVLLPSAVRKLAVRIGSAHSPMREVLLRSPVMGIKTGANRTFFLEGIEITAEGLLHRPSNVVIPRSGIVRCVRGRDVRRWKAMHSTWMLWPPAEGWPDPLPEWISRLGEWLEADPRSLRLAFVRPEHIGIKVAWRDVSRGMNAAVLPDVSSIGESEFLVVPNQTLYSIDASNLEEAYFISAILNSSVFGALAVSRAERAKDFHFRYFGSMIGTIPIPRVPSGDANFSALVRLARQAHRGTDVDADVDALVARLYGIEEREQRTLERYLQERLRTGA
ncbi:MAG: N-6 DNA methylase [Thermoanaerobaculia bacterium]